MGRFAGSANQEQEGNDCQNCTQADSDARRAKCLVSEQDHFFAGLENLDGLFKYRFKFQGAKGVESENDSQNDGKVANPVNDECFTAGVGIHPGAIFVYPVKPEADEQIGTETDSFPADK